MVDVCELTCSNCGAHTELYEVEDNGDVLCSDCLDEQYPLCHDCGERQSSDDMIINAYGYLICDSCRDDYYCCEECSELFVADDVSYSERIGGYVCNDCWNDNDHDNESRYICDYHESGDPKGWMSIRDEERCFTYNPAYHYLGFELEVESNGHGCDYLAESLRDNIDPDINLFRMEHDGSLNHGFEIISNPMTWGYFHKFYPIDKILAKCRSAGFSSHDTDTCGLHIHMSKTAFGDDTNEIQNTIVKAVYIIEKYSRQWEKVARRPFGHYTNLYNIRNLDTIDYDEIYSKRDRYRVLSIRYNTVELRMFKGTLNLDSFKAAVDIYMGLIGICRKYDLKYIKAFSFDEIRYLISEYSVYVREYFEKRLGSYEGCTDAMIQQRINAVNEMYAKIEEEKEMSFIQSYQEVLPEVVYVDNRYMPDEIRYHQRDPECFACIEYWPVFSMTGGDTGIMMFRDDVSMMIGDEC